MKYHIGNTPLEVLEHKLGIEEAFRDRWTTGAPLIIIPSIKLFLCLVPDLKISTMHLACWEGNIVLIIAPYVEINTLKERGTAAKVLDVTSMTKGLSFHLSTISYLEKPSNDWRTILLSKPDSQVQ